MEETKKAYEQARELSILPGYAIIAGDNNGKILYSTSDGKQSLNPDSSRPFQLDTICAIASMTKLMTAVAVMQCVEKGLLDLDKSVSGILPEIGKFGIITDFNEETKESSFKSNTIPITLRMLLTHTSGHAYDWFRPQLRNWRASRNEIPWMGETVEQKATIPLIFEPGKEFAYGVGLDWAGKMVERVTGKTLEIYMQEKIWGPLGIKDITFYPKNRADMERRIASMSNLGENSKGPAAEDPEFDVLGGATDCLGGGGAFASTEAYFTFVQAILCRDLKLLSPSSFEELFKPQLSGELKQFFNDYLHSDPVRAQYLGMNIVPDIKKNWCFAGMICEDKQEGRFSPGTVFWGGMPSMVWWIDNGRGICGVAACQVLPPMSPKIMQLHENFQKAVFDSVGRPSV